MMVVVGQLGKGGLERQLLYLISQLSQIDVEICCVVWNFDEKDPYTKSYRQVLQDNLIGFTNKQSTIGKLQKLRSLVKSQNPQLVISFTGFVNAAVYMSVWGLNSVAIGSLRTSARYYLRNGGFKAKLNLLLPPLLLVNSQQAIQELKQSWLHRLVVKTAFLPNVLDIGAFDYHNRAEEKNYTSISVGNVRPAKRLDRMLAVFKYLKGKGHAINHIHIGGGPNLQKTQLEAEKLGLKGVSFLGPRNDVKELLFRSKFFLHFSEIEGSPNVIMEAMAAGLPVITTDCGDAGRYVKNGKNGFLIESFSTELFASKIMLLKQNEAQRVAMSHRSLELIRSSDWSMFPQHLLESLRQLNLNYRYPKDVRTTV